jgi:hypothetical protein
MPTAHLIYGFLGVGKTTLARQLEHTVPAIRFSHDEWMTRLYGDDPPVEDFPEFCRRVSELLEQVWPRCLDWASTSCSISGAGRASKWRSTCQPKRHMG